MKEKELRRPYAVFTIGTVMKLTDFNRTTNNVYERQT